jgi:hypothetical protein
MGLCGRGSGRMISCMDMELKNGLMGARTMVILLMARNKAKEDIFGQTVAAMWDSGEIIGSQALASISGAMEDLMRGAGVIIKSMEKVSINGQLAKCTTESTKMI